MIRAVIFDMDGLLVDSEPFWQRAEIASFARVGIALTPQLCQQTMGLRTDEMVKYWFDRYPWEGCSLREIERLVLMQLSRLMLDEASPMPGAIDLVKRLEKAGVDMAIASSSPLSIIEAVVSRFGLQKSVRVMRSAEDQAYGKPHPGVFLDTAKDLGHHPSSCLVFEDSINGVIAAKAAKMVTVAVPSKEMFMRPEFSIADAKIASLVEFDQGYIENFLGAGKPQYESKTIKKTTCD